MNRSQTRTGENSLKALAAAMLILLAAIAHAEVPAVPLMIGKHSLVAEVASTESQRGTGLMHRRMLPENRGMLFVFPDIALHGMWMMNTFLPLSVAFIDRDGTIINIADMEPHTTNTHNATRPAKYALEMNQGWFRKRGIKAGDKIQGLEKVPPAR
jgi:uncharacterized membrane protein (UPF0127 family)